MTRFVFPVVIHDLVCFSSGHSWLGLFFQWSFLTRFVFPVVIHDLVCFYCGHPWHGLFIQWSFKTTRTRSTPALGDWPWLTHGGTSPSTLDPSTKRLDWSSTDWDVTLRESKLTRWCLFWWTRHFSRRLKTSNRLQILWRHLMSLSGECFAIWQISYI